MEKLQSSVLYVVFHNIYNGKKKCCAFSILPKGHKGDSVMFLRKRSRFNELQLVRIRL